MKILQVAGEFILRTDTCVDETGLAMEQIQKYFPLNSSYSIKMPNNYTIASNVESSFILVNIQIVLPIEECT